MDKPKKTQRGGGPPVSCDEKAANKWTARVIPAILFALIGYVSWVVTQRLCVDYLLKPPRNTEIPRRPGAAIAILAIYYTLLLPVLICYLRLIHTIIRNPGFLPYGPQWHAQNGSRFAPSDPKRRKHTGHHHGNARANEKPPRDDSSSTFRAGDIENEPGQVNNLGDDFWKKDVFVCQGDGRPRWCSVCMNFKPDRSHHCREVNRCVQKMDHFCPWVGGIVSETSLKFFIQFVAYAALFTLHTFISTIYFVIKSRQESLTLDVHLVVSVAVSGLFALFAFGMTLSTIQMSMIGVTTIENIDKGMKVWFLAVWIPKPELGPPNGEPPRFMTITYPRPPEEQLILQQQDGYISQEQVPRDSRNEGIQQPVQQPSPPRRADSHYVTPRTFAILSTKPGENPFDLGMLENLKQILGYNYLDWFLPINHSPCIDHSSTTSTYKMNNDLVKRLQVDVGLLPGGELPSHRRHRRRHRHRDRHSH